MEWTDLYRLECTVQHYPWGGRERAGRRPFIAELLGCADAGKPFAELWIGAHPKAPSLVLVDGRRQPLDRLLAEYPLPLLGPALAAAGERRLPFLLKVLDCDESLSIQAHPDLARAAILHRRDPEHYPDANHKPEIAIALAGMQAFCQFRAGDEIQAEIERLPPLGQFFAGCATGLPVGGSAWLRALYGRIFAAPPAAVEAALGGLLAQLRAAGPASAADRWFLELNDCHPGDRGLLCAYFLNLVELRPGEAVFLGPNEPHAYLRGTIIECMANSDNVVRAGLTPKFIDREVLVDMLTYRQGRPPIETGETLRPGERVYRVPVPEFQVEVYTHEAGEEREYAAEQAVSLLLVLAGEAELRTPHGCHLAPRGSAWLWPAALPACTVGYRQPGTCLVRARPPA